jgi:hypothetical protein
MFVVSGALSSHDVDYFLEHLQRISTVYSLDHADPGLRGPDNKVDIATSYLLEQRVLFLVDTNLSLSILDTVCQAWRGW